MSNFGIVLLNASVLFLKHKVSLHVRLNTDLLLFSGDGGKVGGCGLSVCETGATLGSFWHSSEKLYDR